MHVREMLLYIEIIATHNPLPCNESGSFSWNTTSINALL
jgi:hypothetical protein